jgi:hypothetical protein
MPINIPAAHERPTSLQITAPGQICSCFHVGSSCGPSYAPWAPLRNATRQRQEATDIFTLSAPFRSNIFQTGVLLTIAPPRTALSITSAIIP